jgi:hypothetical protein
MGRDKPWNVILHSQVVKFVDKHLSVEDKVRVPGTGCPVLSWRCDNGTERLSPAIDAGP